MQGACYQQDAGMEELEYALELACVMFIFNVVIFLDIFIITNANVWNPGSNSLLILQTWATI